MYYSKVAHTPTNPHTLTHPHLGGVLEQDVRPPTA